jgi:hypothetical protein
MSESYLDVCGVTWSFTQLKLGIRANFQCEYCSRDLLASFNDYDSWQIDHILAKSLGGSDEFWNLALCCKACNFIKRHSAPPNGLHPLRDRTATISAFRELISARREKREATVECFAATLRSNRWRLAHEELFPEMLTVPHPVSVKNVGGK